KGRYADRVAASGNKTAPVQALPAAVGTRPSIRTRGQEVAFHRHRTNAAPDEHRGVLACACVSTHASRSRCQSRSVGLGSRSASTSPSAAQTWHGWLAGGVLPPGFHESRRLAHLGG